MKNRAEAPAADPRVEQLAGWLHQQGDDAPGLLEATARVLGFDALLLPRQGDEQHRIHRLGDALQHEIRHIQDACLGREPFCTAAAVREVEAAVAALRRVRQPRGIDRHLMADYARFTAIAEEIVTLLAVAETDPQQRAMLVTRARELIADLREALMKIEDADPEWGGWAAIDPPRGTVFEREVTTKKTVGRHVT